MWLRLKVVAVHTVFTYCNSLASMCVCTVILTSYLPDSIYHARFSDWFQLVEYFILHVPNVYRIVYVVLALHKRHSCVAEFLDNLTACSLRKLPGPPMKIQRMSNINCALTDVLPAGSKRYFCYFCYSYVLLDPLGLFQSSFCLLSFKATLKLVNASILLACMPLRYSF